MIKRHNRLLFKFAVIFGFFTFISLVTGSLISYLIQMKNYKKQCLTTVMKIGDYLEHLIQESGNDFINYQNYYMEHYQEANVPFNFFEYHTAQRKYEKILAETDFELTPQKSFDFDSFSEEAKMAYFVYIHEYWLLTFENARKAFGLPYTYYLVPKEEEFKMVYMIDGERTPKKDFTGEKSTKGTYLYLGDEYYNEYNKHRVEWDTWFTGEKQKDFQVWNNQWGNTYAFYTPVIVNGKKLGIIGTEVEVKTVNSAILKNTIIQTVIIGIVLILSISLILIFINIRYIQKIVRLENNILEYANDKNPEIAHRIIKETRGKDEITSLSLQFANLILKIEEYIGRLFTTSQKLKDTQERADKMDALANRDSLTGIRNKTAYDKELKRLEWQISGGKTNFGIAMIDLNFLKRINDTFGHEQGNIAIKTLCRIVCQVFKHSPVFRIGGDEFVVILEQEDYRNIENLCLTFNVQIAGISNNDDLEPWERVSAALGYAIYDKTIDSSVQNVFSRADKAMYARKKEMKAVREG